MTEGEIELECLEERAAIIQEGEGCSRYIAEYTAAQQAGFVNWTNARRVIMERISKEKQQTLL